MNRIVFLTLIIFLIFPAFSEEFVVYLDLSSDHIWDFQTDTYNGTIGYDTHYGSIGIDYEIWASGSTKSADVTMRIPFKLKEDNDGYYLDSGCNEGIVRINISELLELNIKIEGTTNTFSKTFDLSKEDNFNGFLLKDSDTKQQYSKEVSITRRETLVEPRVILENKEYGNINVKKLWFKSDAEITINLKVEGKKIVDSEGGTWFEYEKEYEDHVRTNHININVWGNTISYEGAITSATIHYKFIPQVKIEYEVDLGFYTYSDETDWIDIDSDNLEGDKELIENKNISFTSDPVTFPDSTFSNIWNIFK